MIRAKPEIKIVPETKTYLIEVSPIYLGLCGTPATGEKLTTTRSLVESRLSWKQAARNCAVLHKSFVEWYKEAEKIYQKNKDVEAAAFEKKYGKLR